MTKLLIWLSALMFAFGSGMVLLEFNTKTTQLATTQTQLETSQEHVQALSQTLSAERIAAAQAVNALYADLLEKENQKEAQRVALLAEIETLEASNVQISASLVALQTEYNALEVQNLYHIGQIVYYTDLLDTATAQLNETQTELAATANALLTAQNALDAANALVALLSEDEAANAALILELQNVTIPGLESDLAAAQELLEQLQLDVAWFEMHIAELADIIDGLNATIITNTATIGALQADIDTKTATITELQAQLVTKTDVIESLYLQIDKYVQVQNLIRALFLLEVWQGTEEDDLEIDTDGLRQEVYFLNQIALKITELRTDLATQTSYAGQLFDDLAAATATLATTLAELTQAQADLAAAQEQLDFEEPILTGLSELPNHFYYFIDEPLFYDFVTPKIFTIAISQLPIFSSENLANIPITISIRTTIYSSPLSYVYKEYVFNPGDYATIQPFEYAFNGVGYRFCFPSQFTFYDLPFEFFNSSSTQFYHLASFRFGPKLLNGELEIPASATIFGTTATIVKNITPLPVPRLFFYDAQNRILNSNLTLFAFSSTIDLPTIAPDTIEFISLNNIVLHGWRDRSNNFYAPGQTITVTQSENYYAVYRRVSE